MKTTKNTLPIVIMAMLWSLISLAQTDKIAIDQSKHEGLVTLNSESDLKILYSKGQEEEAQKQDALLADAYEFLSEIMGDKKAFCVLVVAQEDWSKNAYSPVPGMPEYYKGNLIVGAGQNAIADDYGQMIESFPKEMTQAIYEVYANGSSELDMKLFFDKLSIHELTHNFQDTKNQANFSMSRWLEEVHANMGLYAYYKYKRPNELKYITALVDFSLANPPPGITYTSLADFDAHYYEMGPAEYGNYQMKFTKVAQKVVDSLGKDLLKPLNDFIVRYDDSFKGKMTPEEFKSKLATEVDPMFVTIIEDWE